MLLLTTHLTLPLEDENNFDWTFAQNSNDMIAIKEVDNFFLKTVVRRSTKKSLM